ncbi:hypothetical protein A3L14_01990 [Thermococcus thioreducens]|uniref:Uncharacterized protein n=1 Tax=Thermococcus thioreducens TaxID=277988 RepID=A0A0Q2M1P3_9EURY|nr:hypothetical protein A3L14_01990 [Thermococcus thioreducens]KQH81977.1 hypothetical protein AMR53_08550 [Thermococcus thioreducens]
MGLSNPELINFAIFKSRRQEESGQSWIFNLLYKGTALLLKLNVGLQKLFTGIVVVLSHSVVNSLIISNPSRTAEMLAVPFNAFRESSMNVMHRLLFVILTNVSLSGKSFGKIYIAERARFDSNLERSRAGSIIERLKTSVEFRSSESSASCE